MKLTDQIVYEVFSHNGYDQARIEIRNLYQKGLIGIKDRERLANEIAEFQMMNSSDRQKILKKMKF